MLPRNIYAGDPVIEYFPDYSVLNFFSHLAGIKPAYKFAMTPNEAEKWMSKLSSTNNLPMFLLVLAVLPIVFHKRIPKLKNYTGWKVRVPLSLLYLSVPTIAGGYLSNKVQN